MNVVLLYLLLLKGTVTAFAGLASLPVIQHSLVEQYHVLTNEQLNEAVVITRSTPGPVGLYIVSVGYFAGGIPGAIAGWLAMITPRCSSSRWCISSGARWKTLGLNPSCKPW